MLLFRTIALTCLLIMPPVLSAPNASAPPTVAAGRKLNPGPSIDKDPKITAKKLVVIYYANDVQTRYTNSFDLGVRTLFDALTEYEGHNLDKQFMKALAIRIVQDIDLYNESVDREREALVRGLCGEGAAYSAGLVVFRNSGNPAVVSKDGYYLNMPWEYCAPGGSQLTRATLSIPIATKELRNHPVWIPQPLTAPFAFSEAIKAVRAVFPEESTNPEKPDSYRFILIMKSPGDANHFIAPWLSTSLYKQDRKLIADAVFKIRRQLTEGDQVTIKPGMEIYPALNSALLKLIPNPEIRLLSLSKLDLLEILAESGGGDPKRGMYFSALFADTPHGQLEISSIPKLRYVVRPLDYERLFIRNIDLFYTRKVGMLNKALNYDSLFFHFGERPADFSERFKTWITTVSQEGQRS